MAIRVYKVGEVVEGKVVFAAHRKSTDAATFFTHLLPPYDPVPDSAWKMELLIGVGHAARLVVIDLAPVLSKSDPPDAPVFLEKRFPASEDYGHASLKKCVVYFRDRIFVAERSPRNVSEHDEVVLRIKKATYDEEFELSSLRATVANLEAAAIEFQKSGHKRSLIPEDVKLVVWARDGGCCVRCASKIGLQFDHIIPVAKGGGNSAANIQILCESCNLRKSDKVAIA